MSEIINIKREKKNLSNANRSTRKGYLSYMLENPVYFESLSGLTAIPKNINYFFMKLKKENLVACNCAECNKSVKKQFKSAAGE